MLTAAMVHVDRFRWCMAVGGIVHDRHAAFFFLQVICFLFSEVVCFFKHPASICAIEYLSHYLLPTP